MADVEKKVSYIHRMKDEYHETEQRLVRLHDRLDSVMKDFGKKTLNMNGSQVEMLYDQAEAIENYLKVLSKRIIYESMNNIAYNQAINQEESK